MKNNQPLVSMVIPSYNHAQYVHESIQSVIDQDYDNIELIIIDDGSKDNSVEKIQGLIPSCQERFVRFEFRSRPNIGLSATLNEALEWCEGKYFSTVASDDILLPHKISFLVDKMIKEPVPAVFGGVESIGDSSEVIGVENTKQLDFKSLILHEFIPPAPASLISIEAIKNAQGFDPKIKLEDWYMWLKLTQKGNKIVIYPEIVAKYRRHETNTVNNLEFMHTERLRVLSCFKEHELYQKALSQAYLKGASSLSRTQPFKAVIYLFKSKQLNVRAMKIALKIVLPEFFYLLMLKYK